MGALREATKRYGKPDIINTNQGVQFPGESFIGVLKNYGIRISMDGKNPWVDVDNVLFEWLWRSAIYREFYLNDYEPVAETKTGIGRYF